MKTALILHYSCSGNTRKMARYFKQQIEKRGWSVKLSGLDTINRKEIPASADLILLGVPVHYWDIPDAALERIRKLPQLTAAFGFVFSTFGSCVCNEVPFRLARELEQKGVFVLGGAQVLMPHSTRIDHGNRIGDTEADFGKGEPTQKNLEMLSQGVKRLLKQIETGTAERIDINRLKPLHTRGRRAWIMNRFMSTDARRSVMPQILHIQEECTGCEACILACPAQAIVLCDKRITIHPSSCKKCYRCMEVCPSRALTTDFEKAVFWTRSIHKFAKNAQTKIIVTPQ